MEQRSLKLVETNKTFFSKITNTLTKLLMPTRIGLNSIMIAMKRNNVVKAYLEYQDKEETDKKEILAQKYENNYTLYLEAIDKYIMDSVYKKVKNNTATAFEREYLSKYYLIVSLKEKSYVEYKYRKQEYLLNIDYVTASTIKKESLLKQYQSFYASKMDSLYKGLLKNYSIYLVDNANEDNHNYDKIFETLESYVSKILPIKIDKIEDKTLIEDYEKYENGIIGKLDEKDIIFKKVNLLNISRYFFTHSFPLMATERCYEFLLKEVRNMIVNSSNEIKRDKAYQALYDLMDEYSKRILSIKLYWAVPQEKENYKKFLDEYTKTDLKEEKELAILKYDLKKLDVVRDKQIRKLHKQKLVKAGIMRCIRNMPKTILKKYQESKVRK